MRFVGWDSRRRNPPTWQIASNNAGGGLRFEAELLLSFFANPPYEAVNLSIFRIRHLSLINDLAGTKIAKSGKVHILYEAVGRLQSRGSLTQPVPA